MNERYHVAVTELYIPPFSFNRDKVQLIIGNDIIKNKHKRQRRKRSLHLEQNETKEVIVNNLFSNDEVTFRLVIKPTDLKVLAYGAVN